MNGLADTNLVLAIIKPTDALQARARKHLERHPGLTISFSVGLELLLVARKHSLDPSDVIDLVEGSFELEERDLLVAAASAMSEGEIPTAFDAVHAVDAFLRKTALHTADERLLASDFPTVRF